MSSNLYLQVPGVTKPVILNSLLLGLNETIINVSMIHTLSTFGPQFAHQKMKYNNQTVADKVPPEMLHLIDPHW